MLAKCSNPLCSVPFRYLEEGRLFRLENDPRESSDLRRPEYFWLCRCCSKKMTLRLDEDARVRVAQLQDAAHGVFDVVDLVPLDRRKGLLLNRVCFLSQRPRQGSDSSIGG